MRVSRGGDQQQSYSAKMKQGAHRGEHRQAAGAIASLIATLLSRQCGFSAVSLVSRMNLFQFGASCSFPESIFFSFK
jgi:hypothetical protein